MHDIFRFQDISEGQAAGDAWHLSVSGLNRRMGWALMHGILGHSRRTCCALMYYMFQFQVNVHEAPGTLIFTSAH
jgi:hypothetical protein